MRRGLGGWQTAAGAAVVRGSRGMLPTGVARGPEDCRGVWVPPGWMRGQGLPLTRGPLNESLLPREQRRLNTTGRRPRLPMTPRGCHRSKRPAHRLDKHDFKG